MTKVLLIQGTIPHYRVPIFNLLAEKFDLTVLYSYGELPESIRFKCIKVPVIKFYYYIHTSNIINLAKQFNVVICMMDFSYLAFRFLKNIPHKYKLIYWGIGVSASYDQRYDQNQEHIPYIIRSIQQADAVVFYSDYPVRKYEQLGIPKEKLFVANNTVYVSPNLPKKSYNTILFIGSLYKQKRIDILIDQYIAAYKEKAEIPNLIIIGDGDQHCAIIEQIRAAEMENKITLVGKITDEEKLKGYFSNAIACVSPDQAGLSVLTAMGYGVPFITQKDAITGGEIFNIHHGINGILIDNHTELKNIILDISCNSDYYIEMSNNALKYYWESRRPDQMVQGFVDAVNYAIKS